MGKIDFRTLTNFNYSITEKDTKMTWVDGSNIYRKTFSYILPTTAGQTLQINHGISNWDRTIKFEGELFDNGTDQAWSFPFYFDSSKWGTVRNDATKIYINSGITSGTGVVTIYYTKSS